MSIQVKIAPALQENLNAPGVIQVNGNTIGECLDDLVRQYPQARSLLFDRNGALQVLISINNEETVVMDRDGLGRALHPDEELQIAAVLGGG
ncbi:hypothetical protein ACFLX3_00105 [Chloroflexota bacterium]